MKIDIDSVMTKLDAEARRREDARRALVARLVDEVHRANYSSSEPVEQAPEIQPGSRLYRPVFTYLGLSADTRALTGDWARDVVEESTILPFAPLKRNERGTFVYRVAVRRDTAISALGRVLSDQWTAIPADLTVRGIMCFSHREPTPQWTWLEVHRVVVKKADRPGGRDRMTIFAEPVEGSIEDLKSQFGYQHDLRLRRG